MEKINNFKEILGEEEKAFLERFKIIGMDEDTYLGPRF